MIEIYSNEDEEILLQRLSYIYHKTKHYYTKSEEILPSLHSYLAPILQHRDALDHLMRSYKKRENDDIQLTAEELHKIKIDQYHKACNHEMRAFFDVADFICIHIRLKIYKSIKRLSKHRLNKVWKEYAKHKKDMVDFSERLAKIRENREADDANLAAYCESLDNIIDIYYYFEQHIDPKIKSRRFRIKNGI